MQQVKCFQGRLFHSEFKCIFVILYILPAYYICKHIFQNSKSDNVPKLKVFCAYNCCISNSSNSDILFLTWCQDYNRVVEMEIILLISLINSEGQSLVTKSVFAVQTDLIGISANAQNKSVMQYMQNKFQYSYKSKLVI